MLRFSDKLVERPTDLRKAVILTVTVYCSEKTQIKVSNNKKKKIKKNKVSNRKRHKGKDPGDTRPRLPIVLSQWSHANKYLILPIAM